MCFVPRRRAVCQEEVEKQLFAFAITSKPRETPHTTSKGKFYVLYDAALELRVLACLPHLSSCQLLQLQPEKKKKKPGKASE